MTDTNSLARTAALASFIFQAWLLLLICAAPAFAGGRGAAAQICDFKPASGGYKSGDIVVSTASIKNASNRLINFYAGMSVMDVSGKWHDAPFTGPVSLTPAKIIEVPLAWTVPDDGSFKGGNFLVRMAVWSGPPGAAGAVRLDMAEKKDSFHILDENIEKTFKINGITFAPTPDASRPARNRGKIIAGNVRAENGGVSILFLKGSFNGGEAGSVEKYGNGSFSAEIKTCGGKTKSVTGFFLFDEQTEDEVTIEIFNDGSRRVWLTSFIGGGEPLEKIEYTLPFDPSIDFHEYKINYGKDEIRFFIDGAKAGAIANGEDRKVPDGTKMRIFMNAWFPGWNVFRPFDGAKDTPGSSVSNHIRNVKISF